MTDKSERFVTQGENEMRKNTVINIAATIVALVSGTATAWGVVQNQPDKAGWKENTAVAEQSSWQSAAAVKPEVAVAYKEPNYENGAMAAAAVVAARNHNREWLKVSRAIGRDWANKRDNREWDAQNAKILPAPVAGTKVKPAAKSKAEEHWINVNFNLKESREIVADAEAASG